MRALLELELELRRVEEWGWSLMGDSAMVIWSGELWAGEPIVAPTVANIAKKGSGGVGNR